MLSLLAPGQGIAQSGAPPSSRHLGSDLQVALEPRPDRDLGEGVTLAMFPRVLPGATVTAAVAARINRSLDGFNAEVVADARSCGKEEVRINKGSFPDYSRTVEIAMQGPRYLSLVAEDIYSCGAPHPLDAELALVYDLQTGLPVNWLKWLPPDAVGHIARSKGRPAIGYITWPRMMERVREHDPEEGNSAEDCKSAYKDSMTAFNLWLDGEAHALIVSPQLGSHFDTAMCGQRLQIDAAAARALGVAPELVDQLR